MKHLLISATVIAMLSGVVVAQPIERVKMTDNDLNCQQIYLEIAQMDALIAKNATVSAVGTQVAQADGAPGVGAGVVGAVAQEAVARSGFGGFGGLGGLGGMFGGIAQSLAQGAAAQQAAQAGAAQQASAAAQQNQALVTQQAQGRKEHLTGMFLSKGCRMSDIQK